MINTHTYADTQDYKCVLEAGEDFVFLHLDVHNWNKTVFKTLKVDLQNILRMGYEEGHDYIFVYGNNKKIFKMANMVHPLVDDHVLFANDSYELMAWKTIKE